MSGFLRSDLTDWYIYLPVAIIIGRPTFTGLHLTGLHSGGGRGHDNTGEGRGGHPGIPSADDDLSFKWCFGVELRFPKFNNSKVSQ